MRRARTDVGGEITDHARSDKTHLTGKEGAKSPVRGILRGPGRQGDDISD